MAGIAARRGSRLLAYAPLIVLALVSALSLGARAYRIGEPCAAPCTTTAEHVLMFDESFYVNGAQLIAGIRPAPGEVIGAYYAKAPLGTDPNAEHPQGAKLVTAAAIRLFGDGPFAWRVGALLFGSLAILGMYALVRSAGGGPWTAAGAAALMAADNLMVILGRMAMLDVYALAPLLWAAALYLRGRVLPAAVLLTVAACMKELSVYALLVLGLLELGRVVLRARDHRLPAAWAWRPALRRLATVTLGSAVLFVAGLWAMDLVAPPYTAPPGPVALFGDQLKVITGGPFAHLSYILGFAKRFTSPDGLGPEASYPWQWLFDYRPVAFSGTYPTPAPGAGAIHPAGTFLSLISPPILALAIPALVVCAVRALRRRPEAPSPAVAGTALLAVAWFAGMWLPFELQSALLGRTSYLYYMSVVMPGIYVAVACLASLLWRRRRTWLRGVVAGWGLTVLAAAVVLFPFTGIL